MGESRHLIRAGDSSSCPWIPDQSVSLVVTSPPYPMIRMWDGLFAARNAEVAAALAEGDGAAAFSLMHRDLDVVWAEAARVLRPGGWACVNIGDATRKIGDRFRLFPNHARVIAGFTSLGFDILPPVLWRKQTNAPNKFMGSGMLPAGAYVTLEHEHILVMRKGGKRGFDSEEEKRVRRESAFFWEERNRWFSDVWDFKGARQGMSASPWPPGNARARNLRGHGAPGAARPTGARDRSASFPFELPYRLISMYSVRGDTVFDPFLGTGTTVFAAMASGRNSIGVDLDPALVASILRDGPRMGAELNRYMAGRVEDHMRFIAECTDAGRELAYVNEPHGFPVVTTQETGLLLEVIADIRSAGEDGLEVEYKKAAVDQPRLV